MEVLVMRSLMVLVVMGSVGLLGCAGATSDGAEEGAPALVMLDAEARASGFSLVTAEGKLAPVAPIALEGDVMLVGPGQRIPLAAVPGELLVVTGKRGTLVSRSVGAEVDADAVRVNGTEPSVRALASTLNAKITGEGPWELRAPGLVASLAHQEAPQGVSAIETVEVQAAAETARAAAVAAATSEATPFSSSDPRFASFGPLGARPLTCSDPAAGTWVSVPKFNATYEDWHVFTLHVEPGDRQGEIAGTVQAHIWSGGAEDLAPDGCEGNEMDYRVSMAATGLRAADGSVRFDSGPWQLEEGSCTQTARGYNPDHFSGLVSGGAIRSVNNDGGRAVNDPVGFERISCE
jgi:hypothetical protein